jgi:protein-tyrosine phosphatase
MKTDLFWIPTDTPGRLAIVGRPRGNDWLDDEVRNWKQLGLTDDVSLLEEEEEVELGLSGESVACSTHEIGFHSLPVPDRGVPADETLFRETVESIVERLLAGASIGIHCRQGIGRSGLFAVAVLMHLGANASSAIRVVTAARGRPIPETPEQTDWLQRYRPQPLIRTGTA